MNIKTFSIIILMLTVGSASFPALSSGELRASMIPASMCQPTFANAGKLQLTSLGWSFKTGVTGGAGIWCPVPFNLSAGSGTSANDFFRYRIYYQDPDGSGSTTRIISYFTDQNIEAMRYRFFFNSDNNNYTNFQIQDVSAGTKLDFDRLYGFFVQLNRTSTIANPVFSGFDFLETLF